MRGAIDRSAIRLGLDDPSRRFAIRRAMDNNLADTIAGNY